MKLLTKELVAGFQYSDNPIIAIIKVLGTVGKVLTVSLD